MTCQNLFVLLDLINWMTVVDEELVGWSHSKSFGNNGNWFASHPWVELKFKERIKEKIQGVNTNFKAK